MRSTTIALHAPPELRARALAAVRRWSISTRWALLACAALWIAYAGTRVAAAGASHLHEMIFFTGSVLLALGIAWVVPFLGALLLVAASVSAWLFLDATPENFWLALPPFLVACLLLHRWKWERSAENG